MDRDTARAELQYRSPLQHSMAMLKELSEAQAGGRLQLQKALRAANQLTYNAFPSARGFVRSLRDAIAHPDAHARFDKLLKICDFTDRLEPLDELRKNPALIRRLYDLEGYIYQEGSTAPHQLAVVFTTIFNNFGVASLILLAILKRYGVSVLMLKDCSLANYLGGASEFGENLDEVAQKIDAFAREKSVREVYLLGYSSGGYASCYVSTRLRCAAHLGFSSPADFSLDTTLPTEGFITRARRQLFDPRYLIDLATALPGTTGRQRLIVGTSSPNDLVNARHLRDAGGMEVVELPDTYHDTPETLIALDDIWQHLDWLFDRRAQS